jgi:carbonic anhydrase
MQMTSDQALARLLEGNQRFVAAENHHRTYEPEDLVEIAHVQEPFAAVVACADSRVVPEVLFDQELGSLFVSRVPANVASDGTKWMIDIAVGEFKVPLVVVLAHTGCLAVRQIVEGLSGPGGGLRHRVQTAFQDVRLARLEPVYEATIEQNSLNTVKDLLAECPPLHQAVRDGKTRVVAALYDMPSGEVRILEPR